MYIYEKVRRRDILKYADRKYRPFPIKKVDKYDKIRDANYLYDEL